MKKTFLIKILISLIVLSNFTIQNCLAATNITSGQVIYTTNILTAQNSNKQTRTLSRRSPFYQDDTLRSGNTTTAGLRFTDGTLLTMRPNTTIVVSKYNYSKANVPNKANTLQYSVNFVAGGLRVITGEIAKVSPNNYQITTNVATIGVRGTDFCCVKELKANLYCAIQQGQIRISNSAGAVTLDSRTTNRYAYVSSSNTPPQIVGAAEWQMANNIETQPTLQNQISTTTPTASAPVLPSSEVVSGPQIETSDYTSGFYVGIGAGIDFLRTTNNFTTIQSSIFGTSPPRIVTIFADTTGANGQIEAGYQFVLQNFSLAAEAFGNVSSPKITATIVSGGSFGQFTRYTAEIKNSIGALIEPGFIAGKRILVFAETGPIYSNFSLTNISPNIQNGLPLPFDFSKQTPGWLVGGGVSYAVNRNVAIKLTGSYIDYNKINDQFGPTIIVPAIPIVKRTAFSTASTINQFELEGIYHF